MFKILYIPFLTPETQNCSFLGQCQSLKCANCQLAIDGKEYLWSAILPLIIKG